MTDKPDFLTFCKGLSNPLALPSGRDLTRSKAFKMALMPYQRKLLELLEKKSAAPVIMPKGKPAVPLHTYPAPFTLYYYTHPARKYGKFWREFLRIRLIRNFYKAAVPLHLHPRCTITHTEGNDGV